MKWHTFELRGSKKLISKWHSICTDMYAFEAVSIRLSPTIQVWTGLDLMTTAIPAHCFAMKHPFTCTRASMSQLSAVSFRRTFKLFSLLCPCFVNFWPLFLYENSNSTPCGNKIKIRQDWTLLCGSFVECWGHLRLIRRSRIQIPLWLVAAWSLTTQVKTHPL